MMREPPLLARWTLQRFTTADEFVRGDLLERYGRGDRSTLWYWRQVFSVVAHDAIRDFQLQPVRLPLAIAAGLVVVWWGAHYVLFSLLNLPEWLFATGIAKAPYANGLVLPYALRDFPAVAGWKALVYAGSAWIVMRTAPTSSPAIAFAYVPFVVGADVIIFVRQFSHYPVAMLTTDLLILYPLAALVGGLIASNGRTTIRRAE